MTVCEMNTSCRPWRRDDKRAVVQEASSAIHFSAKRSRRAAAPSLAATRVQQASASGRPATRDAEFVSPYEQRTPQNRRAARGRKVIEEAHQQRARSTPSMAAKSKMTEQETAMMKLVTIEEIQEAAKRPSREETAGCANRLTFTSGPLLAKGWTSRCRTGPAHPSDQAANVSQRFRKAWDPRGQSQKNGGTPDLFGAQLGLDGGYLRFFTALLLLRRRRLQLVPAVCLNILVKHFEAR